jgi:hypothetical protein
MKTHLRIVKREYNVVRKEHIVNIYIACQCKPATGKILENSTPFRELVTCKKCIKQIPHEYPKKGPYCGQQIKYEE